MSWAFRIAPLQDELLSGYLCRVARAHGASPYGFCELHLGDKAFWARDCDRGYSALHEAALAAQSGLAAERIGRLTLRAWIDRLTPESYSTSRPPAITPWINPLGVFHRTRRQHALQFCPACLAEIGTVKRPWRLSFLVVCPVHRRPLLDACPTCDAPFVPHRAPGRISLCHACHRTLGCSAPLPIDFAKRAGLLLSIQESLMKSVDDDDHERSMQPHGFDLWTLRQLMSACFAHTRAREAAEVLGVDHMCAWDAGPRLEMARHPQRYGLMTACAVLLDHWPHSFRSVAARLRITRRRLAGHFRPCPEWLSDELSRLPPGRPRAVPQNPPRRLAKVDLLALQRPANWRAARAEMLLRAARRSG